MLKDKNLYCVGGYIRDEILGIKNLDIDYCYQGNAIEFAKNNFQVIKENPSFGTVKALVESVGEVDIASTREERYPRKGHLPEVFNIGCSLEEDLKRRDFTMNTLCMNKDGNIIDLLNGMNDINSRVIKTVGNSKKED